MSNLAYFDRAPADVRSSPGVLRVTHGAQVTLYIHPAGDGYTPEHLAHIADAVRQIEVALRRGGIMPGTHPASDVVLGRYASYRNDRHADREGSPEDRAGLVNQPVYQCLRSRYAAS